MSLLLNRNWCNIVEHGAPFEAHITDPVQKQFLHEKLFQAQFFSMGTLFTNAIFFYGKRIWLNIRKRDLEFITN